MCRTSELDLRLSRMDIIATIMGRGLAVSYKATLCISKLPTFFVLA